MFNTVPLDLNYLFLFALNATADCVKCISVNAALWDEGTFCDDLANEKIIGFKQSFSMLFVP